MGKVGIEEYVTLVCDPDPEPEGQQRDVDDRIELLHGVAPQMLMRFAHMPTACQIQLGMAPPATGLDLTIHGVYR